MIKSLQDYINTRSTINTSYLDNSDHTFINDILYGIGLAIDCKKYNGADGFIQFKKYLVNNVIS